MGCTCFEINTGMTVSAAETGRVAILLSTYQGERFLKAQLESLVAQTLSAWTIYWRDDGSTDGSREAMQAFARTLPPGRCVFVAEPTHHVGAPDSYFALLAEAVATGETYIAFADQDDVWLPGKLARAHAALAAITDDAPALYCARQILVDAGLRRIGLSFHPHCQPNFPAALTQNIATGCTIMLNRAAARLIAASAAPATTIHDWWCYIVVSAAGGRLLIDDQPVVLYRQHKGNMVGAPVGWHRRAVAALRRGPDAFMSLFRQHVSALSGHAAMLTPRARRDLHRIEAALQGNRRKRLHVLTIRDLRRQTWHETLVFRLWFMLS